MKEETRSLRREHAETLQGLNHRSEEPDALARLNATVPGLIERALNQLLDPPKPAETGLNINLGGENGSVSWEIFEKLEDLKLKRGDLELRQQMVNTAVQVIPDLIQAAANAGASLESEAMSSPQSKQPPVNQPQQNIKIAICTSCNAQSEIDGKWSTWKCPACDVSQSSSTPLPPLPPRPIQQQQSQEPLQAKSINYAQVAPVQPTGRQLLCSGCGTTFPERASEDGSVMGCINCGVKSNRVVQSQAESIQPEQTLEFDGEK